MNSGPSNSYHAGRMSNGYSGQGYNPLNSNFGSTQPQGVDYQYQKNPVQMAFGANQNNGGYQNGYN